MNEKDNPSQDRPERLHGGATSPDTKSWYEHVWKTQQETPARLEEAAKFLSGVISITLTLFLTVGKSAFENVRPTGYARTAVALWLLSLVLCILVIFPRKYRYCDTSVESIKEAHRKIVRTKSLLLLGSLLLFLAALTILVWQFF